MRIFLTLRFYNLSPPQMGWCMEDGPHSELRLLDQLRCHRRGRMARFRSLPVPKAVIGSEPRPPPAITQLTVHLGKHTQACLTSNINKAKCSDATGSDSRARGHLHGSPVSSLPILGKDANWAMFPETETQQRG